MVRRDAVDHFRRLVIALGHLDAQLDVRAFQLVIDGFANVVEQARALGKLNVRAQLRRHQARQMTDLNGMLQHVLTIAGAELQPAQQLHQLMVDAMHVRFKDGLLARLADLVVHLALGLIDHFLDARRMNAAVGDELFQRNSRNLTADGVKRGHDNGFRRIVDDEIDAGHRSSVRMLRPSRPMMRPFMSSFGRDTTETVVSATWSLAQR